MVHYFIVEIQGSADGKFAYLVHSAEDSGEERARAKAESVYYQVLAAAAISELPMHSAILFGADGQPVMWKSYTHVPMAVIDDEVTE